MVNEKIYAIYPSNDHAFINFREEKKHQAEDRFNMESRILKWESRDYRFYSPHRDMLPIPDASVIVGGALAINGNLKNDLFPAPLINVEFLPISVEGEDWVIINCLEFESKYDREASVLYRGTDGDIFLVASLKINVENRRRSDIFVIEDSNRATIFAFQPFVDRFRALNFQGLSFREVGNLS